MRRRPTQCGQKHTKEADAPSDTAKKRRCKCGAFHVWVEPAPKKERCKSCGQVLAAKA